MELAQVALFSSFAVQWLRARKNIPEGFTLLIQAVIGLGCYVWAHGKLAPDAWQWVATALGITQAASSLANMGIAIPKTNSV